MSLLQNQTTKKGPAGFETGRSFLLLRRIWVQDNDNKGEAIHFLQRMVLNKYISNI